MEKGAAVDIDDLGDPVPVDELQRLVIVNALRGPGLCALAWIEDEVVLVQLFRCQVIQFLPGRKTVSGTGTAGALPDGGR